MTKEEWKVYWSKRAVKAEMKLIEIQSMLDEYNDPMGLSDKISGHFNDIAKSDVSLPKELADALQKAYQARAEPEPLKLKTTR